MEYKLSFAIVRNNNCWECMVDRSGRKTDIYACLPPKIKTHIDIQHCYKHVSIERVVTCMWSQKLELFEYIAQPTSNL